MSKILVTGGCGLIGRGAVAALVRLGYEVRVLDTLAYGIDAPFPDQIDLVEGSVGDVTVLSKAMAGIDRCLHLAGSPVLTAPRENPIGTGEILKAAATDFFEVAGARKIPVVYASSAAVYGNSENSAIKETAPILPVNAHGMEKAALEDAAAVYGAKYGVPSIGLRMFNVYGSGQSPASPYCGVVRRFAERIMHGMSVTIRGSGQQLRDFVYVDDAVRAAVAAVEGVAAMTGAEAVNVCTGRPVTLLDVVSAIRTSTDLDIRVDYDAAADAGVECSVGSPDKAKAILGFQTEVSLETGVGRMMRELLADAD